MEVRSGPDVLISHPTMVPGNLCVLIPSLSKLLQWHSSFLHSTNDRN